MIRAEAFNTETPQYGPRRRPDGGWSAALEWVESGESPPVNLSYRRGI